MDFAKFGFSTITKGTTPILLARILNSSGQYLVQDNVQDISLEIFEYRSEKVLVHRSVVNKASSIFNSLVVDNLWKVDGLGYNFKHIPNYSFDKAETLYSLYYKLNCVGFMAGLMFKVYVL